MFPVPRKQIMRIGEKRDEDFGTTCDKEGADATSVEDEHDNPSPKLHEEWW